MPIFVCGLHRAVASWCCALMWCVLDVSDKQCVRVLLTPGAL